MLVAVVVVVVAVAVAVAVVRCRDHLVARGWDRLVGQGVENTYRGHPSCQVNMFVVGDVRC